MTPNEVISAALSRTRDQTVGELADRIVRALDRRGYTITRKERGSD